MKFSIQNIFKECKSAFYHGKAFKRMELGKYESAARILESLVQENPNGINIEYSYYSIGRCYFRMGNLEKALLWLSKSDEIYNKNIKVKKNYRNWDAYQDMLQLYKKVLMIKQQKAESTGKASLQKGLGS